MTRKEILFVASFVLLLFVLTVVVLLTREKASPKAAPVALQPVDDQFWLNLDRRHPEKYREQLRVAPQALVVRESHYAFNPTNGMGAHYGWVDGKLADLHITFSELVGHAYGKDYAHTEFPEQWTQGHLTNTFDVIVTITNQPREAMQAEARKFLKQQFGLAWHHKTRETDVLLIRAKDPELLQSKVSTDFPRSKAISELAGELENYFGLPVIDETGATNRYEKALELVPARWVNGRTTDLVANNKYLASFGLELVSAKRSQDWLLMDQAN